VTASVAFRAPNWLGDAVMATVVPPAIKRARPSCRLTVFAREGLDEVFAAHPDVDDVVSIPAGGDMDAYRGGTYDAVLLGPTSFGAAWRALRGRAGRRFGFATSGRGWLLGGRLPRSDYRRDRHQVENYRALAGLVGEPSAADEPWVGVTDAWRDDARSRWPADGERRVALQPGATYGPAKRWSPERFAALARDLLAAGHSVLVLGGPGDADEVRRVREGAPGTHGLTDPVGVGTLAALLERADLLVTNDTGPMHLAAAVGTKTLAIFGSTSPTWTRPWGEGHVVVDHPVPCAPCYQRTCGIGYKCLEGIAVDRVVATAREMLQQSEVRS
jgi:heptosyltransferase-2